MNRSQCSLLIEVVPERVNYSTLITRWACMHVCHGLSYLQVDSPPMTSLHGMEPGAGPGGGEGSLTSMRTTSLHGDGGGGSLAPVAPLASIGVAKKASTAPSRLDNGLYILA